MAGEFKLALSHHVEAIDAAVTELLDLILWVNEGEYVPVVLPTSHNKLEMGA